MLTETPFIRAVHAWRAPRDLQTGGSPDVAALHEVFQNSTVNALLEGVYDGSLTYGELRRHGDFGLGTFNALDGEMVAFDGDFYQIKSDGFAYPVADEERTPFATVLFFAPKRTQTLTGPLGSKGFQALAKGLMEGPNLFYAVRVDGHFRRVKTRSMPRRRSRIGTWTRWRRSSRFSISKTCGARWWGFASPTLPGA